MPKHPTRLRLATGLAALATLAVPAVGALGTTGGQHDGRSYRQTGAAYKLRSSKNLARGVHLDRYVSRPDGRKAISDVLTVNLGRAGVSAGILSGAVTQTASVKHWATRSSAVAAVNGDYFDISSTQAPDGAIIRSGTILKGTRSGQSVVGQGRDGRMRTGTVYLDSTLHWGRAETATVEDYNTVLSAASLPHDGVVVFDSEWGSAPLRIPGARHVDVIAVGAHHRVLKVSHKIIGQRVPPGGMLLVATGGELGHLRRGAKVTEKVGVRTSAPVPFAWGLGYGLSLMRATSVIHNWPNDSDPRDARTAIGWKDDGRTMVVVTVEYGGGSHGEEVNAIADELAAQGATDGVLLDGGGSTTLVARAGSHLAQVGQVSTAGHIERRVPISIGIFVTRHG